MSQSVIFLSFPIALPLRVGGWTSVMEADSSFNSVVDFMDFSVLVADKCISERKCKTQCESPQLQNGRSNHTKVH